MHEFRHTVYVVGAGFSRGCGYPLTVALLPQVFRRLQKSEKRLLQSVIAFHHPHFDKDISSTYPTIEQLLTEIAINIEMFASSRSHPGGFAKSELFRCRNLLLNEIVKWFHELFDEGRSTSWLNDFSERVIEENAAIISFNWDLLLDDALLGGKVTGKSYGLDKDLPPKGPLILKPHGSLNWYSSSDLRLVKSEKRTNIFKTEEQDECVEAFLEPRQIVSKIDKKYSPLLVPPTFLKDFKKEVFVRLWRNCTNILSTPKRLIFLGYSLPSDDLQARFILRCGFHNQKEGRLLGKFESGESRRAPPTGAADVIVINPDPGPAERIRELVPPEVCVRHIRTTVESWLAKKTTTFK